MWRGSASKMSGKVKDVIEEGVFLKSSATLHRDLIDYLPIFPCFRVRFFVAVPCGSFSHFQEPTRSYLRKSPDDALVSAKSTVIRTCVSTRDLVPPSGILGTNMERLDGRKR